MLRGFIGAGKFSKDSAEHLLQVGLLSKFRCVTRPILKPVGKKHPTCLEVAHPNGLEAGLEFIGLEIECYLASPAHDFSE
jgi:hypothetical protein